MVTRRSTVSGYDYRLFVGNVNSYLRTASFLFIYLTTRGVPQTRSGRSGLMLQTDLAPLPAGFPTSPSRDDSSLRRIPSDTSTEILSCCPKITCHVLLLTPSTYTTNVPTCDVSSAISETPTVASNVRCLPPRSNSTLPTPDFSWQILLHRWLSE